VFFSQEDTLKKRIICFFTASFIPQVGGVERYVFSLATRLVKMGHSIYVVTSHFKATPWEESIEGIQVLRVPALKLFNGSLNTFLPTPKLWKQFKVLKRANVEIVITNTRFYLSSIIGIHFAKKNEKAVLHIEHGSGHIPINNSVIRKLGEWYDHILAGYVRKNAPLCYGVSLACNEWLSHFNIKAIGVIYNGIDTDKGKITKDIRKDFHLGPNTFVFSSIGRLIPEKGFDTLIDAFQEVKRYFPDIHSFPTRRSSDLARADEVSGITLLGSIAHEDVMSLLCQTDVFVFPSQCKEGMPTTILEAAISGSAIIATPQGGTVEIIKDGDTGLIIPSKNAAMTAEAMKKMLYNPGLRQTLSNNVKEYVLSNFTWDNIVNVFLDAVEKALAETTNINKR
jgi:glycosyltransferase involved in cell wall biosynthesis